MPASAATKNTPPSTTSADKQGAATKPTSQHAPISPSTATTNSNPMPNAESSTSPSPPSKKDSDNKETDDKMSSVSCCTICNSISLFPSRPIPHHPTSSHLSHHSYIFISLGFSLVGRKAFISLSFFYGASRLGTAITATICAVSCYNLPALPIRPSEAHFQTASTKEKTNHEPIPLARYRQSAARPAPAG